MSEKKMTWAQRSADNLLPLSKEKNDLAIALREWFYNGETYDLEQAVADCELCDHPEIRYQFGISNRFTSEKLLVGSECITKFGIDVLDEDQNVLGKKEGKRRLNKDRRKLITDAALKRVVVALIQLATSNEFFSDKIESFINYYKDRSGFTPKQLLMVIRGFRQSGIQHRKSDFKLKLRRHREMDQLLKMSDAEVSDLWSCLSKSQQLRFMKRKNLLG